MRALWRLARLINIFAAVTRRQFTLTISSDQDQCSIYHRCGARDGWHGASFAAAWLELDSSEPTLGEILNQISAKLLLGDNINLRIGPSYFFRVDHTLLVGFDHNCCAVVISEHLLL